MIGTRPFTPVIVALFVAGCELGLGGEAFVARVDPAPAEGTDTDVDASAALASPEAAVGSALDAPSASPDVTRQPDPVPDAATGGAANNARQPGATPSAGTDGASSDGRATADGDAGAQLTSDASPAEVGDLKADDAQDRDATSACDLLSRCCQLLAAAPPISISCYAGLAQADGGDACVGFLANIQDAGLCH